MGDEFKDYTLNVAKKVNDTIIEKFKDLKSEEIEKCIQNLHETENMLLQIEKMIDDVVNKMIQIKANQTLDEDLSLIN
jgi:hypothetical protein